MRHVFPLDCDMVLVECVHPVTLTSFIQGGRTMNDEHALRA
jgi:hypothetical protein